MADTMQDLERRVKELEVILESNKRKRQQAEEWRESSRKKRHRYHLVERVVALLFAYPLLVLFLFFTDTPRPWIHALTPAIMIFVYVAVASWMRQSVYNRERNQSGTLGQGEQTALEAGDGADALPKSIL